MKNILENDFAAWNPCWAFRQIPKNCVDPHSKPELLAKKKKKTKRILEPPTLVTEEPHATFPLTVSCFYQSQSESSSHQQYWSSSRRKCVESNKVISSRWGRATTAKKQSQMWCCCILCLKHVHSLFCSNSVEKQGLLWTRTIRFYIRTLHGGAHTVLKTDIWQ